MFRAQGASSDLPLNLLTHHLPHLHICLRWEELLHARQTTLDVFLTRPITNPLHIHKQPLLHLVTVTFVMDMVLYVSHNVYISSSPDCMQYEIVYCSPTMHSTRHGVDHHPKRHSGSIQYS